MLRWSDPNKNPTKIDPNKNRVVFNSQYGGPFESQCASAGTVRHDHRLNGEQTAGDGCPERFCS
jgi:hypothetical protein